MAKTLGNVEVSKPTLKENPPKAKAKAKAKPEAEQAPPRRR